MIQENVIYVIYMYIYENVIDMWFVVYRETRYRIYISAIYNDTDDT